PRCRPFFSKTPRSILHLQLQGENRYRPVLPVVGQSVDKLLLERELGEIEHGSFAERHRVEIASKIAASEPIEEFELARLIPQAVLFLQFDRKLPLTEAMEQRDPHQSAVDTADRRRLGRPGPPVMAIHATVTARCRTGMRSPFMYPPRRSRPRD